MLATHRWYPMVQALAFIALCPMAPSAHGQETSSPQEDRSPSSFLECEVEAKVVKVERRATVNAEIAEALELEKEMIGKLGVAAADITILQATSKKDQAEDCARLKGQSGRAVIRYELANKELKLEAGEVIQLHYWAFAGFAPYGVPGKEVWWVGPPPPR